MRTLECSTHGDIRFSAMHARVMMFGINKYIEDHYQTAKNYEGFIPSSWRDVKGSTSKVVGKKLTGVVINGMELGPEWRIPWYHFLWLVYLDENPTLVQYAKYFDNFTDRFRGTSSVVSQADVIRMYVKDGREAVLGVCVDLIVLIGGE
jgi:hypothetical protein